MNLPLTTERTQTFLENLRRETRYEHSRLEDLPVSRSIVSENLTIESYALYLQLMYPVVAQIEACIFPLLTIVLHDLDLRSKLGYIESDLTSISAKIPTQKNVLAFPASISTGFALGIAYVLEGSTLGGRFILNNVSRTLNLSADNGASYFAGYQNATGSRWKDFLNAMQLFITDENQDDIVAGARFAFSSFYEQLNHD